MLIMYVSRDKLRQYDLSRLLLKLSHLLYIVCMCVCVCVCALQQAVPMRFDGFQIPYMRDIRHHLHSFPGKEMRKNLTKNSRGEVLWKKTPDILQSRRGERVVTLSANMLQLGRVLLILHIDGLEAEMKRKSRLTCSRHRYSGYGEFG